jgi:hypothetical protein
MGNIPEHVNRLERVLRESEFELIGSGERHLTNEIYPAVKAEYPRLCDDSVMCDQTCSVGADQEEWKHRVRTALGKLRDQSSSRVSKGSRNYWRFD